jgi:hypothetical protein
MTDKNENTAIPAEAKEWGAEPVVDMANSSVEKVAHKFRELESHYTVGVERKEDGLDKDIVSSSIDAVKDPIGSVQDCKRLQLLDLIAEVQRKYLESEDVSVTYSLLKAFIPFLVS